MNLVWCSHRRQIGIKSTFGYDFKNFSLFSTSLAVLKFIYTYGEYALSSHWTSMNHHVTTDQPIGKAWPHIISGRLLPAVLPPFYFSISWSLRDSPVPRRALTPQGQLQAGRTETQTVTEELSWSPVKLIQARAQALLTAQANWSQIFRNSSQSFILKTHFQKTKDFCIQIPPLWSLINGITILQFIKGLPKKRTLPNTSGNPHFPPPQGQCWSLS